MIQMGQQTGSLCGLYLKAVTPEAPELDDSEPRLEWNVRGSRAQGTAEDELVVAFA
jgi:hypothetical protein